jgi:hypothetical protein
MIESQTYTVYHPVNDLLQDDKVIARSVSSGEAIEIALKEDACWSFHIVETDYCSFCVYQWQLHSLESKSWDHLPEPLTATVIKTTDREKDKSSGMSMIAAQFIRNQQAYFKCAITTDREFDERLRRTARRREVQKIDREIVVKLVDAALSQGYAITCDLMEDDPSFKRSTDRNGILEYLLDVEMAELVLHKDQIKAARVRLIFDESGWASLRTTASLLKA